ncbi:unnamed protein product, partial [Dibothriocephalus latus]
MGTTFILGFVLFLIGLPIYAYLGAGLSTYALILAGVLIVILEEHAPRRKKPEPKQLPLSEHLVTPVAASCEASPVEESS